MVLVTHTPRLQLTAKLGCSGSAHWQSPADWIKLPAAAWSITSAGEALKSSYANSLTLLCLELRYFRSSV